MPFFDHLNVPYLIKREGVQESKPAIVYEGRTRTYGELRDRALSFAQGLKRLGVSKGDRVAVLLNNCLEFWEINFGILETGAVVVPLNTRLAPAEVANLAHRSGAQVVVYGGGHGEQVEAMRVQAGLKYEIFVGRDHPRGSLEFESLLTFEPEPLGVSIRLEDPCEIIYTSGTTGLPKGAVWTHGTVLWSSVQQCMDFNITEHDSTYVTLGSYYAGGRHDLVIPLFHQGGTVHLRRTGNFDPGQVLSYIAEHRISVILLFPTMLHDITRHPDASRHDLSSVRMILFGGASISDSLIRTSMALFSSAGFIHAYGATEAGVVTQLRREDSVRKLGSCGKPALHNLVQVVDETGNQLPPEEVGEIVVKSPVVIRGYWENPGATEQTLGEGRLRTGDLGRFDQEGFLYIVGRKKDMINSGGMKIYPEEIETVLLGHPKVADVAVIAVPDERWGESVMAVVVATPGENLTEEEVVAHCRRELASYKKPRYVEFVSELPRTASGKVQKHELRAAYRARFQTQPT